MTALKASAAEGVPFSPPGHGARTGRALVARTAEGEACALGVHGAAVVTWKPRGESVARDHPPGFRGAGP